MPNRHEKSSNSRHSNDYCTKLQLPFGSTKPVEQNNWPPRTYASKSMATTGGAETCWESVDNKHLTVASCWFFVSHFTSCRFICSWSLHFQHKFYHAYDSIICFEDVKVRFGLGRKSVFEGTICRAHFLLSLVIAIDKTILGKCDFPGKIVFTAMNFS